MRPAGKDDNEIEVVARIGVRTIAVDQFNLSNCMRFFWAMAASRLSHSMART
jgi:hypothetical protein